MYFVVIVEGCTEEDGVGRFLRSWLNAENRLRSRVGVHTLNLKGGGDDLFAEVAKKARSFFTGQRSDPRIIGVIGLLDLYNPSFKWPPNVTTRDDRFESGIERVEGLVNHPQFRMFFAVHEVEAWILSQPENLHPRVYHGLSNQDRARMADPEAINFSHPPAKLLNALYRRHLGKKYKKRAYGPRLLHSLNPERAYEKCDHLARMLDEMLALARQAGC